MITVYTAVCNGWDNLRPPLVSAAPGVRYICFTDLPMIPSVAPWEFRPLYDLGVPARTARLPKILPHLLLPPDTEVSIYHDANFQLIRSPRAIAQELLQDSNWAAHKHPARNCLYAEAEVLLNEKIGTPALVESEISRYRKAGYGEEQGLWANGFLVRRHTPQVAALNELWWKMFASGCERDQLSFPFARKAQALAVNSIPENVYASPYILFRWHAAWSAKEENVPFVPQRAKPLASRPAPAIDRSQSSRVPRILKRMIEEGLTKALAAALVTAGLAVPGGFFAEQLPKDVPSAAEPKAWGYRFFGLDSGETLKGQNSWTEIMCQIDCHGWNGAGAGASHAIVLAHAIEVAMRTIGPTRLDDADHTFVDSIHFEDQNDGFNDASRSYVRSLDFLIQFHRN